MSVLVITGTGSGVGKTVVTAAVAALARARGASAAVVKPAQTGPGSDLDEIIRMSGVTTTFELARYPDPLSPAAAARACGLPPVSLRSAAHFVAELAESNRLVLVEGAGGLLERYDEEGATIADLAKTLNAQVLVVAGTINHTALTLEALAHRGLDLAGLVIGSWPEEPGPAERSDVADLEMLAARPLAGAMKQGAGALCGGEFLEVARAGLGPTLGGAFDPARFRG